MACLSSAAIAHPPESSEEYCDTGDQPCIVLYAFQAHQCYEKIEVHQDSHAPITAEASRPEHEKMSDAPYLEKSRRGIPYTRRANSCDYNC
jgi:hypothetical protein